MALIDFTPGLQAIGKMFEDKGKMDLDLYQRQKQLDEENKILKFNNLMYQALSNIKDEEQLLEIGSQLNNYAVQNKIVDKVGSLLNTSLDMTNKKIQYRKQDEMQTNQLNLLKESDGVIELNGQIGTYKDLISNLESSGYKKNLILENLKLAKPVQYLKDVVYDNNKWYVIDYIRTDTQIKEIGKAEIIDEKDKLPITNTGENLGMALPIYMEKKSKLEEKRLDDISRNLDIAGKSLDINLKKQALNKANIEAQEKMYGETKTQFIKNANDAMTYLKRSLDSGVGIEKVDGFTNFLPDYDVTKPMNTVNDVLNTIQQVKNETIKIGDNEYLIGNLLRKISKIAKNTDVETAVNTIAKQYKFENLKNFKKGLTDLANTEFYSDYFTNENYKE